jgi:hypothetical protein
LSYLLRDFLSGRPVPIKLQKSGLQMRETIFLLFACCAISLSATSVSAQGLGWRDNAFPFDFVFENHFDTHQQSMVTHGQKLIGFFYIRYTGAQTGQGVPVAVHTNGTEVNEEVVVGWMLHGIPVRARLLIHTPGQHPTWLIDPADLPAAPGYTHFHWVGAPTHGNQLVPGELYDGWLLKLTAVRTFFFQHHGGFLVTPGMDTETHANVFPNLP